MYCRCEPENTEKTRKLLCGINQHKTVIYKSIDYLGVVKWKIGFVIRAWKL